LCGESGAPRPERGLPKGPPLGFPVLTISVGLAADRESRLGVVTDRYGPVEFTSTGAVVSATCVARLTGRNHAADTSQSALIALILALNLQVAPLVSPPHQLALLPHGRCHADIPDHVTSRTVVWLFLEQLRLEFVPVLHRLQGRLAAQS